jgi:hypothetical protein
VKAPAKYAKGVRYVVFSPVFYTGCCYSRR